jgi:hypothetical protein
MFSRTLQKSSARITNLCSTKFLYNKPAFRMASSTRRFAPLGKPATEDAPQLQGIVFDMDGTLCKYKYFSPSRISTKGEGTRGKQGRTKQSTFSYHHGIEHNYPYPSKERHILTSLSPPSKKKGMFM